ncbi:hypothetical protein K474DRAFT_946870 [Panus rudis PR-1116 ss-1]|nr:hypothetical protein K474DRAFT_946870 [Panus rudis PR-1116 ss-1]
MLAGAQVRDALCTVTTCDPVCDLVSGGWSWMPWERMNIRGYLRMAHPRHALLIVLCSERLSALLNT